MMTLLSRESVKTRQIRSRTESKPFCANNAPPPGCRRPVGAGRGHPILGAEAPRGPIVRDIIVYNPFTVVFSYEEHVKEEEEAAKRPNLID